MPADLRSGRLVLGRIAVSTCGRGPGGAAPADREIGADDAALLPRDRGGGRARGCESPDHQSVRLVLALLFTGRLPRRAPGSGEPEEAADGRLPDPERA